MGICYRATRHWRSHQKIVSCLRNSSTLAKLSAFSSLRTSITPSFLFLFFFFSPRILISYHCCKNIVPQYSILHYVIEGTNAKSATVSRPRSWGEGKKREEEIPPLPQWKNIMNNFRRGFSYDFASSRFILNRLFFISCFSWLLVNCISVTETWISSGKDFKLYKEVNKYDNK